MDFIRLASISKASTPSSTNNDLSGTNYSRLSGSIGKEVINMSNNSNVPRSLSQNISPKTTWEIPFNELSIFESLGIGSYGAVYKGKWRGSLVAIKMLLNVSSKGVEAFEMEANLMKSIRPHSNVVMFQGISFHEDQILIVAEFLPKGNLWIYVSNASHVLDKPTILNFLRGIAAGMLHLSSEGIVHRDLAARNILLTETLQPKVSDFGMSRVIGSIEDVNKTVASVGPIRWMAPECLVDNTYSVQTDIWAFGVVMFEVIERKVPYENLTMNQVAVAVATGTHKLQPTQINPLSSLMKRCLTKEPSGRPSFSQICADLDRMR